MKKLLLSVALLVAPISAEAKCHKIWHYNFPQHCYARSYSHHHRYVGHHRYYGHHKNHTHRFAYYPHFIRHKYVHRDIVRVASVPKEHLKPEVQTEFTESCKHTGDYDRREYAMCLLHLQMEIYKVNKQTGMDQYKEFK